MLENIIRQDLENVYARNIPWYKLRGSVVFVTGAYGMLASYVCYMLIYLNEKENMGIHILAGVRSEKKFRERFGEYADAEYITICTESLDKEIHIPGRIDYIIHAASLASPQYYDVCPVDVLRPNVIGNYYLLELAVRKNVKGYLLFSTGDIYGFVKDRALITETDLGVVDTLDIHSCYSESKRMAETMCYAYYHQYNVPVKLLRIWHTYAPTMDIERDPRVFASFVKNVVYGQDIVMKSDGSARRSFCYIADAVAGYFLVLLLGKTGEAYNVCNTKEYYSVKELAKFIVSLRPEMNLKVVTRKRSVGEHYVENTAIGFGVPDDSKLRSLGWRPEYDVLRGFGRVIDAHSARNLRGDICV